MTSRALRRAHWITTGLRRKVESSSASRPRLQHGVGSSLSDWWKFCPPTSNPDSRRWRAFSPPPPPPSELDLDYGENILRGRLQFPAILGNRNRFLRLFYVSMATTNATLGFASWWIGGLRRWVDSYDSVLTSVIGMWWIDIDDDKQHSIGGTEKKFGSASSFIIFRHLKCHLKCH